MTRDVDRDDPAAIEGRDAQKAREAREVREVREVREAREAGESSRDAAGARSDAPLETGTTPTASSMHDERARRVVRAPDVMSERDEGSTAFVAASVAASARAGASTNRDVAQTAETADVRANRHAKGVDGNVRLDRLAEPASVFVPPRSWRSDLRAIRIVWHRDLIRFWHDRPRIIASALQPMLYLFVFGTGMGAGMRPTGELDLRVFLYPGVMAMATLFTCFFSAGSIVWDREFGFMREMLVAPVRRGAIVVGKALGGATAGMTQGVIVLAIGPLVGVPFSPVLIVVLLVELAVLSFAITSIGVLVAVRIKSFQAFMALVQIIIMPMFFLSGALFPFRNLPAWLDVATRLDPLTYAVDPMRRAVLADVGGSATVAPLRWGSWTVPTLIELAIVAATGVIALIIAGREFGKVE